MNGQEEREVLLNVEHLCMHFHAKAGRRKTLVKAVDDVSFQVYRSETFGLVGESGCGKTTTGRTILRLHTPTSGNIEFDGRSLTGKMTKELQSYLTEHITCIFQDPIDSLNPRMTVREIIGEGLFVRGIHDRAEIDRRVFEVLEKVGLTKEHANRYPHEFSGGQRQRIGIARAIIVNPSMVIADEPVSALDVSVQAQVINLLNDLKREYGLTIIFVAHNLSVVKYFSDRIGVMYRGKLLEVARSDDLYEHPIHPYTKSLLSAIPMPNPLIEKERESLVYDAKTAHDYSTEQPHMVEILPEHFVYGSESEILRYRRELKGDALCC